MREIKFRAWDNRNKKMRSGRDYYLKPQPMPGESSACLYWLPEICFPEDLEIMQYTGLKDKNGVEIYEGDIVQHENGQISLVEWSDGDWGWLMKSIKNWNPKTSFNSTKDEVIGNIYENKDLLK